MKILTIWYGVQERGEIYFIEKILSNIYNKTNIELFLLILFPQYVLLIQQIFLFIYSIYLFIFICSEFCHTLKWKTLETNIFEV